MSTSKQIAKTVSAPPIQQQTMSVQQDVEQPQQPVVTNATATSSTSTITNEAQIKPFEMNTYIQLEIESSNSLCIPRICKFYIKKLQIQKCIEISSETINSIYIAIKLNISKRILRTIEIPINQQQIQQQGQSIISIDLNLYYNIIYPHYIKKDTNYLYVYIQRRKKYKNRTILGYKTLAHTIIDLNSCIQKPVQQQQNLFLQLHHQHTMSSSSSQSQTTAATKTRRFAEQICGYVTVDSLCSNALDCNELERRHANSVNKNDGDLDDLDLDDYEGGGGVSTQASANNAIAPTASNSGINAFINAKNRAIHNMNAAISGITGNLNNVLNLNNPQNRPHSASLTTTNTMMSSLNTSGHHHHHHHAHAHAHAPGLTNSDSDAEIDTPLPHHHRHKHSSGGGGAGGVNNKQLEVLKRNTNTNLIQPTKRLTNKLISFLRKLRNEADSGDVDAEGIEEEYDQNAMMLDDDMDIEQISDFSDTEFDDSNLDLYSIISTPKPNIQPFFKRSNEIQVEPSAEQQHQQGYDEANNSGTRPNDEDYDNDNDPLSSYNALEDSIEARETFDADVGQQNTSSDNELLAPTPPKSQPITIKTTTATINLDQYKIQQTTIQAYLDEQYTNTNDTVFYLINEQQLLHTATPPVHLYTKLNDHQQQSNNNFYSIRNDNYLNDFKLFFEAILQYRNVNRIKQQHHIKIILIGTDQFLNQFLQVYIELFKTQELIGIFKFYYVPYFVSTIGGVCGNVVSSSFMLRFLCNLDQQYASLFGDELWLTGLDTVDGKFIMDRIRRYLSHSNFTYIPFQICEAMVIFTDGSPPQFIPFICDFRIGDESNDTATATLSPIHQQIQQHDRLFNISPPNSPHLNQTNENDCSNSGGVTATGTNEYDLQVDYWAYSTSTTTTTSSTTAPATQQANSMSTSMTNAMQTQSSNSATLPTSLFNAMAAHHQPQQQQQQHQTLPSQLTTNSSQQGSSSGSQQQAITTNSKISKTTIKSLFKRLQIFHHLSQQQKNTIICQYGQEPPLHLNTHNLSVVYSVKEKKQKSLSFNFLYHRSVASYGIGHHDQASLVPVLSWLNGCVRQAEIPDKSQF